MRGALEYVEKEFSSRPYREVLDGMNEGLGNLTDGLTPDLTSCLTGYLTSGLTFSGVPRFERPGKLAQDARERERRRSRSASARTFVITLWWTPSSRSMTAFRGSDLARSSIRATVCTGCLTALDSTIRSANASTSGAGFGALGLPCAALGGAVRVALGAAGMVGRGAVGAVEETVGVVGRGAAGGTGTLLSWGDAARWVGAPTLSRAAIGLVRTRPRVAPNTLRSMTAGARTASAEGTPSDAVKE